ncbi:MAG: beta-mannosidase [Clostridia bacterium]|nr:beta-mannosidase [Clostridia bacterium]
MKKSIAALLAAALLTVPAALAEDSTVYEAENASFTGKIAVSSDAKASGGKVVGRFENPTDTVTFTITVPADGVYDLTFVSKGIGGGKYNNVLVDGQDEGQFQCSGTTFEADTLRGILLSAGEHTVTITPSWGWIYLDRLEVTAAESIPDSVYNVDATLINPCANEDAKQLFAYLCESYGKVTLSGQVCDYGTLGPECRAIHAVTGKYPAILGLDMMDYTPSRTALGARGVAVDQAIKYHKEGGLVAFCWHWNAPSEYLKTGTDSNGSPRWWGGFYTDNTTFDIAAVMNGVDTKGKELLDRDIAEIARQLLRLQEEGVPVLWRPLHEASGGWFWWGAKGAAPCKQLWIYLYNELTFTYGCNNLIWVWNGQNPAWYPGDEYVDIIGEDIYAAQHSYGPQTAKFMEVLDYTDSNKIIALTENGVVPDIEQMVMTNARWAWFNTWCGDFVQKNGKYNEAYTEAELLRKVYDSEYVITRDELPDFN